jgi:DNA-binding winged helix-turn-helix (wHTH) protein/tetratricopeptide (TPR) repeat protein
VGRTVRFRDVTVDFDGFRLVRDGVVIPTQPQVFDVLEYLIDHRDRVVSKEELLDNIWGDRFVSESTLTTRIKTARQVTGDDGQRQEVIQTVHGRGYRFVCPLADLPSPPETHAPDTAEPQLGTAPLRRRLTVAPERLVERHALVARLHDALASTEAGNRVVVVRGEAGIGKSALVQTFVDRLDDAVTVAVAACAPLRTPSPLAPFADLLVQLDEPGGADLASAFDAAERLRRRLHGRRRTVVVIDDLHWADDGTFDAIALCARATTTQPVLFVFTYRTNEITPTHSIWAVLAGLRALGAVTLDVESLTVAGVQQLLGTDVRHAADLWRRTGGNPLFTTHVLGATGNDVPGGVQDIVTERLARLPEAGRTAVQLMAMSPVDVELPLASTLLGPSIAELAHAERVGLVTVHDDAVTFRHDVVRSAVHDTVPSLERIGLHRRFCEALPSTAPAARRLHHASEGVLSELVAELGPSAARAAAGMGAHRQASDLYQLVLRPRIDLDAEVVAELTEEHAYQLYLLWELARAESTAREAARCWRQLDDRRAEGRSLTLVARILLSHEPGASLDAARRAIELLEPFGESSELVAALSVLAALHVNESDTATAREHAQRALDIAERQDDPGGCANALNFLGCAANLDGRDDWEHDFRRALELALEAGDRESAVRISHNLQLALWDHGRLTEAQQVAERTSPIIAGVEHQAGVIAHRLASAHIAFALGRDDEALSLLDWVRTSDHAGAYTEEVELLTVRIGVRHGDETAREQLHSRWQALVAAGDERPADERGSYHRELLGVTVAEMACTTGDVALADEVAAVVVRHLRGRWRTYKSELLFYLHLTGSHCDTRFEPAEPFATAIRGDLAAAAASFDAVGRRHEAALCRARIHGVVDRTSTRPRERSGE